MNHPERIHWISGALLLAAMTAGCGSSNSATDAGSTPDSGADVAPVDAGTPDTGVDAGTPATDFDVGNADTGVDSGTPGTDFDIGNADIGVDNGTPDGGTPDTGPHQERPMRVAYVDYTEAGRAQLWVQRPDGSERRQVHFTGVVDDVPGQDPHVPTVTDEHVRGVHRLAWSPDGVHLALVLSTAADQSEVVVFDVDAGGGAVVSANGQYVMPALDWSADGRQIAYVMSTLPRLGALDLFVADAAAHRWRRVTPGLNLRGLGVQVRFVTDASAVLVSRIEDQGTSAPWDWHETLLRVDAATGAIAPLDTIFTGRIDAMSRDLSAVYAVRNRPDEGHKLVSRAAASGSAETVLIDDAVFVGAAATAHDRALLITSDARSAGSTDNAWQYRVLRLPDSSTRVDVPPAVERVAVWVDPAS